MQDELIDWYQHHKRDLPWRKTQDPYKIWISEIMLQQTTTEAVIPYYLRFIDTYDNVSTLALAQEEDIYKLWEGLGYYRRAKYLHISAKMIVDDYHGEFPKTYEEVIKLKGVGEYTAGAICSIAYGLEVPAVDGNVLRIMARYYGIKDNIAKKRTQKQTYDIVAKLIKGCDASTFNQGLMDLGATICTQKPKCDICPINTHCLSYQENLQNILPINIKNIKKTEHHYITGIITYHDQYMLIKNTSGMLENMYGFIQYECESPYTYMELFEEEFQHKLSLISYIDEVKHVFTHRKWTMHIYHFMLDTPNDDLYTLNNIHQIPLSTAHNKVLQAYKKADDY
ncbi:MAG: A/G-specific adenine glycosylase [Erysipelotrichaceae bacterium]|nr:A/G-specific adenine glycosylase [Erysipelotrichaceae bacterium]